MNGFNLYQDITDLETLIEKKELELKNLQYQVKVKEWEINALITSIDIMKSKYSEK